jgi:hypothetical protein
MALDTTAHALRVSRPTTRDYGVLTLLPVVWERTNPPYRVISSRTTGVLVHSNLKHDVCGQDDTDNENHLQCGTATTGPSVA